MENSVTITPADAPKKRRGRPRVNLDINQFEELCKMQCTRREIAGFFSIDEDTLCAWCKRTYGKTFEEIFEQKREGGRASLRRRQWLMAERNPVMAIFLGKQYLGQSDDPQRAAREQAAEDRLGNYIDTLVGALTSDKGGSK